MGLRSDTDILGPEGLLSRSPPGARGARVFEVREGQRTLGAAVSKCLDEGGILLAEAGTGTGKTLAYLSAAWLSGRTVVVSTATRALQDQVAQRELPLLAALAAAEGEPFEFAVLKGRSNYLCRLKFDEVEASMSDEREAFLSIARWAAETQTGDRAEVPDVAEDDAIWEDLTVTNETCLSARCPLLGRCFVTRARAAAARARVVVVNHHLYFADAAVRAGGGAILPEHEVVIFDEAHAIADTAATYFGARLGTSTVAALLRDARSFGRDPRGSGPQRTLDSARSGAIRLVSDAADGLFSCLRPVDKERTRQAFGPEALTPEVVRRHHALDAALLVLADLFEALSVRPPSEGPSTPPEAADESALKLSRRAFDLRTAAAELLDRRRDDWVYFRETSGAQLTLHGQPISAGRTLEENVFSRVPSVVLTSATLTTGGSFRYLRERLGISDTSTLDEVPLDPRVITELRLVSPFDYVNAARIYLPKGMPQPDSPDFPDAVAEQVCALAEITQGRAFVLFTSHRNLEAVFARLNGPLRSRLPYPLLKQGEASRSALLDAFRARPGTVLLAAATFWEGVDVPGETLSLVIIDKVPFGPPDDPVLVARSEQLVSRGGNPFSDLQLPTAALALQQGVGRLIRSSIDRGIIALLDPRLTTRGYGKRLLASLPPAPRESDLEALRAFWQQGRGQPASPPGH